MILSRDQVARYLGIAREVGRSRRLYDVHVSPFEVIFDTFAYHHDPLDERLEEIGDEPYRPPAAGALRLAEAHPEAPAVPPSLSTLMYRKLYSHIGPRVLGDHMALSGISTSLLIPVVSVGTSGVDQFRLMFELYPDADDRFAFAYCPPGAVPDGELAAELARVATHHGIRAVKVHPNLQAIDLGSDGGRTRMEAILDACDHARLPVMIHGGRSPVVPEQGSHANATLDHLATLDWARIRTPVILGHAGMFGCSPAEAMSSLPLLREIMNANDGVVVDLSGLGFETLRALLAALDHDRVVFGSDALYFPQWGAVATLLHALDTLGISAEDALAKIAGANPARILGPTMEVS